jgi:hypothetical protein
MPKSEITAMIFKIYKISRDLKKCTLKWPMVPRQFIKEKLENVHLSNNGKHIRICETMLNITEMEAYNLIIL